MNKYNKYTVYGNGCYKLTVYAAGVKIDEGALIFTGSMGTIIRAVASGQWNDMFLTEEP